jgi:glycosyltransferase involved in cell wall biosynthesis
VITPAYNAAATLDSCVRSVLEQTVEDFDYVIVDNNSTDETAKIAEKWSHRDHRISVVTAGKLGSSAARNCGLSKTEAPFVAFVDADDIWQPTFIETLLPHLAAAPESVFGVFGHTRNFCDAGRTVKMIRPPKGRYGLSRLLAESCPPGNGSCLIIRRSSLAEAGGFDESMSSAVDFDMWVRMAESGQGLICIPTHVADYRVGLPNSISSRTADRITAVLALQSRYETRLTPRDQKRALLYPTYQALQSDDPRFAALRARLRLSRAPSLWMTPLGCRLGAKLLHRKLVDLAAVRRFPEWSNQVPKP